MTNTTEECTVSFNEFMNRLGHLGDILQNYIVLKVEVNKKLGNRFMKVVYIIGSHGQTRTVITRCED